VLYTGRFESGGSLPEKVIVRVGEGAGEGLVMAEMVASGEGGGGGSEGEFLNWKGPNNLNPARMRIIITKSIMSRLD